MSEEMDADTRITVHEAICAKRYEIMDLRLGRVEKLLWGLVAGGATYGLGIIGYLATKVI